MSYCYSGGKMRLMDYKSSLIGWHNPHLHKNLTPEQFLEKYIQEVLIARAKKKDGRDRMRLAGWIKENWKSQLKYVARLFPTTLKTT